MDIVNAYRSGEVVGWAGVRHPELAQVALADAVSRGVIRPSFELLGQTRPTAGKKMFLHDVVRKVLGKDTTNYAQEIGDCVSFGAKNASEYLQCTMILMAGQRVRWRPVFPPYYYGTGRVYVGGGRLGNSDGSLGSWMAEAVQKYGTLFSDDKDVPAYSGRVAKSWGDPRPAPDLDKYKAQALPFLVRSAALVATWEELVAAICNGYPCTTASNIGYQMEPSSDGFHRQSGSWAHQMCFIGVDDNDKDPYALILNSWGDAHGKLKDFTSGEPLPAGTLRVRRKDVEKHLRARETFAFSDMVGFPERDLERALFDLLTVKA